jgi:hypothetical protein
VPILNTCLCQFTCPEFSPRCQDQDSLYDAKCVFQCHVLGGKKAGSIALVGRQLQVLDVLSKSEFSAGSISGAINIPVDALQDHITELVPDRIIITVCAEGRAITQSRQPPARKLLPVC